MAEPATLGREQQLQKWQFGAHSTAGKIARAAVVFARGVAADSRQPAHVKRDQGQQDDEDGASHGTSISRAAPDRYRSYARARTGAHATAAPMAMGRSWATS